jgi:hypothetical protein
MKIKKTTLLRSFRMKTLQRKKIDDFGSSVQNVSRPPEQPVCQYDGALTSTPTDCLKNSCSSDNTNGGKKCRFGGEGGDKFVGLGKIKKIQLVGGEIVDAISINGTKYGGSGGSPSDEITLDDDEYISEVSVEENFGGYYGQIIVFLEFKTSKGQSIKKGKSSPLLIKFKNIKVTEISGSAGDYLDSITINYINK